MGDCSVLEEVSSCLYVHVACVKDLIRALREDDSQCEIRRQLGKAGVLKKVRFIRGKA